jgi:hypothetical protein
MTRTLRRPFAGLSQLASKFRHLPIAVLGRLPQLAEGFVGGELLALHEDALGLADDVSRRQRPQEIVGLAAKLFDLRS